MVKMSQAWWLIPVIPLGGKYRKEDHRPRPTLGENIRPYLKKEITKAKRAEAWLK
jgi:hypothetical protein